MLELFEFRIELVLAVKDEVWPYLDVEKKSVVRDLGPELSSV